MKNTDIKADAAQNIAIEALAFLAQDSELLPRFLALTGIQAEDIRAAARAPGFLAGVLQFYLAHEPTLLRFCEASGNRPADLQRALHALPGGDEAWDRQV
ncbi:hypothetical protein GCM10011491_10760 [Brucella endophytica]|uniref:DUF3572 family protein n=1 Tax=Brucella endophytica TaxID=1963359 RepID=A0A916S7P9_9HYPH|nr:DUF3572 domain-containing protein [Brucella endophytica]GGA85045.1 hypothetical protein GCM10011491_10760 [Brucella endophytica]